MFVCLFYILYKIGQKIYCDRCRKGMDPKNAFTLKINNRDMIICPKCGENKNLKMEIEHEIEMKRREYEYIVANAPKIQCPFCHQWFPKLTNEQYRTSAELNVLKWAIVPAWGVVGALKNKPFIECPFCKMKIMQG